MSIRCIFKADTGCLIEFNTNRSLDDGEIEGFWDKAILPPNGIIYDFALNAVREATVEEAEVCRESFLSTINASRLEDIVVFISNRQLIPRYRWIKILWNECSIDNILDEGSSIQLFPASYSIVCQITPLGTAVIRSFRLRIILNGQILTEKWYGGLYYQRKGVSFSITGFRRVTEQSQLEIYVYSDRSFRLETNSVLTYLRLLKIEG